MDIARVRLAIKAVLEDGEVTGDAWYAFSTFDHYLEVYERTPDADITLLSTNND